MIKDVIRLKWQANLSHEQIATTLNISKGAVSKYVGLSHAAGLDWKTVHGWSGQRLTSTLLPKAMHVSAENFGYALDTADPESKKVSRR